MPVINFAIRLWLLGSLVLAGIDMSAETAPPPVEGEAPAPGLLSPRLKAALVVGGSAYQPVKPTVMRNAGPSAPAMTNTIDGELLVLPSFVVQAPRPVKLGGVLSMAQKLDHYLGPKDGFDRGLLNRIVLRGDFGAWSIALFDAVENETRAKELYFDDQRLRDRAELLDFASLLKETGDTALSDRLKRESDGLFYRKPALKRK